MAEPLQPARRVAGTGTEQSPEMPAATKNHYNMSRMRIIFACASLALLGSLVWMVKVDYARPWRQFQDDFTELEATLAYFDVLATRTRESRQELAAAKAAVDATVRKGTGVAEARRALVQIEKRTADASKRHEQLSSTVRRGLFNLPLLDFLAPRGTVGANEIKQIVVPDVRRELNFVQADTVDRCTTCHLVIASENFTKEQFARRLEKAISSINEQRQIEGKPELVPPAVEGRGDLAPGDIARAWRTLTEEQQNTFFDALLERINGFQAQRGERPLCFTQPLLAHPDPDLFVLPDSPHPASRMGCTVCHEGSGEETDFVLAAHTPATDALAKEWRARYYVRTAGLAAQHTFETARAGWDRPMLPLKYTQASCTKCHPQVADMAMYDGEPAATRINEGRFLFTSLGCVNCHLVAELKDASRVGPDLTHVGEKLTRGFTRNWIRFPAEYRPSTRMPHLFRQENNDGFSETAGGDGDPELRTKTEVIAMTEYLFGVSRGYRRQEPPEELWDPLKDEDTPAALAAARRGHRLYASIGCLACHATLAHKPYGPDGLADEPIGATWIVEDLVSKMLPGDEHERARLSDEAYDAIWDRACDRCGEMTYVDRVEYVMRNLPGELDTIFNPEHAGGPVFTRSAPELSSIRTKFQSCPQAVWWLYDWLKDPRRYSGRTKMPRQRLAFRPGELPMPDPEAGADTGHAIDSDEALDIAVYLSTLDKNRAFSTGPLDKDGDDSVRFAGKRDELIRSLLGRLHSAAPAEALRDDEGTELTSLLITKLAGSWGQEQARTIIKAMDLQDRRWLFLGQQMVGHYGCYACHLIPGFEETPRLGPELTGWGEKQLSQLDFGLFDPVHAERRAADPLFTYLYPSIPDDPQDPRNRNALIRWAGTNPPVRVGHTRASFAWHKVRNPRIWDRKIPKRPYDKLKMPNLFVTDAEADALVTFLLSRKPARVNQALQVDYHDRPAGWIAAGRNLARELNCVGCHLIDGNRAAIHQYYWVWEGGQAFFDEANAPPRLRGEGAKTQGAWLFGYLHDVVPIRPWLQVRMPGFNLTDEQATQLVEYFVGLSGYESQWLSDRLARVQQYVTAAQEQASAARTDADGRGPGWDWYRQGSLAGIAEALRRYARANRVVPAHTLDPTQVDPAAFSAVHQQILREAGFLERVFAVAYPFSERPPESVSPDEIADGETLFAELQCLKCHVFGDRTAAGANANPTAPNLQLIDRRLRREWIRHWLAGPRRLLPGTKMPNFFGERLASPFAAYPPDDRAEVEARLRNREMIDDGAGQIRAIAHFMFDASRKRRNVVRPPEAQHPSREGVADAKD